MKKTLRIILKISRISLAIVIIAFTGIIIAFSIINYKLSYEIPPVINIELYDNQNQKYLTYTNGKKQSYIKLENIKT